MRNVKKLILAGGASALMAVTALTGCSMIHHEENGRTAGRTLDDKDITESVKHDLNQEPVYKFTDVDVKTYDGVVQLSGFVNTDDQRRRAGEIAQRVQGVAQVINDIAIKPNLTPTGQLNQTNQYSEPNPSNQK